jgi:hypothetical protein
VRRHLLLERIAVQVKRRLRGLQEQELRVAAPVGDEVDVLVGYVRNEGAVRAAQRDSGETRRIGMGVEKADVR